MFFSSSTIFDFIPIIRAVCAPIAVSLYGCLDRRALKIKQLESLPYESIIIATCGILYELSHSTFLPLGQNLLNVSCLKSQNCLPDLQNCCWRGVHNWRITALLIFECILPLNSVSLHLARLLVVMFFSHDILRISKNSKSDNSANLQAFCFYTNLDFLYCFRDQFSLVLILLGGIYSLHNQCHPAFEV